MALWNALAFCGHLLSRHVMPGLKHSGEHLPDWILAMWHVTKLDNILCIAAMLLFLAGLKGIQARVLARGKRRKEGA